MIDVLFTGFGPFGSYARNPSSTVAEFAAARVREHRLVSDFQVLDVGFERAWQFWQEPLRARHVVHVGLAAGRAVVSFERVARNQKMERWEDEQADSAGSLHMGPAVLETPWDVDRLIDSMEGYSCEVSEDAGNYVCNAIYYYGLAAHASVLFVHVPMMDEEEAATVGTYLGEAVIAALTSQSNSNS